MTQPGVEQQTNIENQEPKSDHIDVVPAWSSSPFITHLDEYPDGIEVAALTDYVGISGIPELVTYAEAGKACLGVVINASDCRLLVHTPGLRAQHKNPATAARLILNWRHINAVSSHPAPKLALRLAGPHASESTYNDFVKATAADGKVVFADYLTKQVEEATALTEAIIKFGLNGGLELHELVSHADLSNEVRSGKINSSQIINEYLFEFERRAELRIEQSLRRSGSLGWLRRIANRG